MSGQGKKEWQKRAGLSMRTLPIRGGSWVPGKLTSITMFSASLDNIFIYHQSSDHLKYFTRVARHNTVRIMTIPVELPTDHRVNSPGRASWAWLVVADCCGALWAGPRQRGGMLEAVPPSASLCGRVHGDGHCTDIPQRRVARWRAQTTRSDEGPRQNHP